MAGEGDARHAEADAGRRVERTPGPILAGVRILDLTRLAPGPYCTMLLADMGAEVIVVGGGSGSPPVPALSRGKHFVTLDLKTPQGRDWLHRLARRADVLIEGHRPGVSARLGIDYASLRGGNPRLIYCSLTGYGQCGPLALEPGHDLNFLALSGALGAFGPQGGVPSFPLNLLADFAGGSLFAALGIVLALYARERSGEGQYIDAAMLDGCISLMAMHFADWGKPVLRARGDGVVAGSAPFYRCYRCADGRFVAVGALERRFFVNLWQGLGEADPAPDHMDRAIWPALTARFERTFATRPRDAWIEALAGKDACITPVLDPAEALAHPHNRERHPDLARERPPVVPGFSSTPGRAAPQVTAEHTMELLRSLGLSAKEAARATAPAASGSGAGLAWPPL